MLNKISIENFKSIAKVENFALKPLTVLTGKNSSGKSNLLEAISFFYQATYLQSRNQIPTAASLFTTPIIHQYPIPLENYIVYKKNPENNVSFQIEIIPDDLLRKDLEEIFQSNAETRTSFDYPDLTNRPIETVGYNYSFKLSDSAYQQLLSLMIPS